MRLVISTLVFLCFLQSVFAQKTNSQLSRRAVEHLLEEKIRVGNLTQAIEHWKANAGQPIPDKLTKIEGQIANSRSQELVVHDDELAESEVHAAINPADTNNIIAAAITQDPNNFLSPLDIPIHYTTDFGTTWKTSSIEVNPGGGLLTLIVGGGDPVLAFDRSGTAYLSWLVLALENFNDLKISLFLAKSTDKGKTWTTSNDPIDSGTATLDALLGGGSGSFVDKQWMATDLNAGTPKEGNLYVSYTELSIMDTIATSKIFMKTKKKTATNFNPRVQIHQNEYEIVQFSSVDVDKQGNVHVVFFAGNSDTDLALYHVRSTDGVTFEPEVKISPIHFSGIGSTEIENPIAGVDSSRLYPCPHVKAGKTAGTLFVTWTGDGLAGSETDGYDIYFSKSTDYGKTWSTPKTINSGGNLSAEQFYAALSLTPNGTLCLAYYDRTDDPNGTETHHVAAFSFDEGKTFTPPVAASMVSSDFASIGDLNAGFGIGEYTQIVSTDYHAIPVWSDGRTNDGDIDIYAARIPISNNPSGAEEIGSLSDKFSVFGPDPNPSTGRINLKIELKQATQLATSIFDASGRTIHRETSSTQVGEGIYARVFMLPAGIYFCKVETEFGWKMKKIVVE